MDTMIRREYVMPKGTPKEYKSTWVLRDGPRWIAVHVSNGRMIYACSMEVCWGGVMVPDETGGSGWLCETLKQIKSECDAIAKT